MGNDKVTGSHRPPPQEREGEEGGGAREGHTGSRFGQRCIQAPTEVLRAGSQCSWEHTDLRVPRNAHGTERGEKPGGPRGPEGAAT